MSDETITYGKFVTKKTAPPAIEVDCSSWADPSVTNWTYGKFVTKKSTGPAIVSGLTVPYLRVNMPSQPDVSRETFKATTKAMVLALRVIAPDLVLEYTACMPSVQRHSTNGSTSSKRSNTTSVIDNLNAYSDELSVAFERTRSSSLGKESISQRPPAVQSDAPELNFGSSSLPQSTFDHVLGELSALYVKAQALPEIRRKQELDRISDAVVHRALELCDQDIAEAESAYEFEESAIHRAGGVILDQARKIADALADLRSVVEAAQCVGIRFVLERDDNSP